MKLHLENKEFEYFIRMIGERSNINFDIIEKDYYVCMILQDLSNKQDKMQAYFKGGTAVYKILDDMNRFSEDIDLTVKVLKEQSKGQNNKRLKMSALGYNLEGLELIKNECIDNKGSITATYKYESVFGMDIQPLHRAGKIQVESTSFTVSEPTEKYVIETLIYKLANDNEKEILEQKFDVKKIPIEIIKLERMFVDKIFATEFYYVRNMYLDMAKHLYDITILMKNDRIKTLLKDRKDFEKLVQYKRLEEKNRIGGINENIKVKDFSYLKFEYNDDLFNAIKNMQNKYVLREKYKVSNEEIKYTLAELKRYL